MALKHPIICGIVLQLRQYGDDIQKYLVCPLTIVYWQGGDW